MANNESGLSDGALRWMIDQLTGVGVLFSNKEPYTITPSHMGVTHKPWLHSPWNYRGVKIGSDISQKPWKGIYRLHREWEKLV